jgi:hypothetical protein
MSTTLFERPFCLENTDDNKGSKPMPSIINRRNTKYSKCPNEQKWNDNERNDNYDDVSKKEKGHGGVLLMLTL